MLLDRRLTYIHAIPWRISVVLFLLMELTCYMFFQIFSCYVTFSDTVDYRVTPWEVIICFLLALYLMSHKSTFYAIYTIPQDWPLTLFPSLPLLLSLSVCHSLTDMHQPFVVHDVNSPGTGCQLLMSPLDLFNLEISAWRYVWGGISWGTGWDICTGLLWFVSSNQGWYTVGELHVVFKNIVLIHQWCVGYWKNVFPSWPAL